MLRSFGVLREGGMGSTRLLAVMGCVLVGACLAGCTSSAAGPEPTGQPEPGLGWATFIRGDCEWSGAETSPSVCFGNRGPGFRVRVVRREGSRWYVWDPSTNNYAYVDRSALSLPAELTADVREDAAPPSKAVVMCIDRSNGYRYTDDARSTLAAWIEQSARPGDVFYVRWIEENSYRPEAEAVPALRVPPVATAAPALATPRPPNPFDVAQVAQATATSTAIKDAQASVVATREAAARSATEATRAQLDAFLQQKVARAASSDVGGCVLKGSELLAGVGGDRYLVIASAAGDGAPSLPGLKLDRVQVRLVYLQCDDPARCEQTRQSWSALAAASNAAGIRFSDPSQALGVLDGAP
jgi:hypothetical protein